jgi:hypothetical protein
MSQPRSPLAAPTELAATPFRLYAQAVAATQAGMAALFQAQAYALEGFWSLALRPLALYTPPSAPPGEPSVMAPAPPQPIVVTETPCAAQPPPRPTGRPNLRVVPDQPAA